MTNKIIIGFDGTIRAGKTSLIKKLASAFKADTIGEYKEYATKSNTEFPNYPPKSYSEAIKASKYFINLEQKRINALEKCLLSTEHRIILVDRTYLSCLGFDYSANYFTNLKTFPIVKKLWDDAEKITPDLIFFMKISHTNIKKRMLINNDNFPPHISDKYFNNYLINFFEQEYKKNNKIIKINANKKMNEVELTVKNYILKYLSNKK